MHTKLTLRMDEELIQKAKSVSSSEGKSLSRMVADYFEALSIRHRSDRPSTGKLGPITKSLRGSLKTIRKGKEDYLDYLGAKHR